MNNHDRVREIKSWQKVIIKIESKKNLTIDDVQQRAFCQSKIEELYSTPIPLNK